MPISAKCSSCGGQINAPDQLAGRTVKCPKCATVLRLPAAAVSAIQAMPPLPSPAAPAPGVAAPLAFDFDAPSQPEPGSEPAQRGAPGGSNGMAIAGMVLGIVGFVVVVLIPCFGLVLGVVLGILGTTFSGIGLAAASRRGSGKGMAITGLVLSILAILWVPIWYFLVSAMFLRGAGQLVKELNQAAQQNNQNFNSKPVVPQPVMPQPGILPPASGKLTIVNGNATISDALVNFDRPDRVRGDSVCKIFIVNLAVGKTYQIDMLSNDAGLDPYLRLEDSLGNPLTQDADSGGDRNARIRFVCPRTGDYRVVATTFAGGTGDFTLTVIENGQDKGPVQAVPKVVPKVEANVVPKVETKTNTKSDLQPGDWAEYRFLNNGKPEWTRKLSVIGHEGNKAKVRYETVRNGKVIPAMENLFPLDQPFDEKGHTLPTIGKQGKRTITLLSEKQLSLRFGETTLVGRVLQFRESMPFTLDGQGELRTEETFWLCPEVPFGGLLRSRKDGLIIGGKAGMVTVLELVKYSRGGKTRTGPLADSGASPPKPVPEPTPQPADMRRRLAELIALPNREADALKAAEEYHALQPNDPEEWLTIAQLRLLLNDTKGYRAILDYAFQRQPAVQREKSRAAYLTARMAGLAPLNANEFKLILPLGDLGTKVEPKRAWPIHAYAMLYLRSGNDAIAIAGFERSKTLEPQWLGNPLNMLGAALALHHQGKKAEAARLHQQASDAISRGLRGLHYHDLLSARLLLREWDALKK